jgi:hypothetical protein
MFVAKRGEIAHDWRKLHDEDNQSVYSLANNVRLVTWRRVQGVGHVAGTKNLI